MAEGVELIQRFYDEMIGEGNLDKIDELVTDDVVDHQEGLPGQPEGKEGVAFFVNTLRGAFSDIKATVDQSLESGDLACAHVTLTGKHTGDWMGVPASDKSFEIAGGEHRGAGADLAGWRVGARRRHDDRFADGRDR